MACLRKQRTKRGYVYVIDFTYAGKRRIRSTKTSNRRIAEQILHDIQGRIARGNYNLEDKKKQITLARFFEDYFAYARGHKKRSTISSEEIYTRKFLEFAGDRAIRTIDSHLIDLWQAHALNTQHLSPTTFNIERRALHSIFNTAKKWNYLDENPFSHIKSLRVEEKRLYMNDEEIRRLFATMDQNIANAKYSHHRQIHELFRQYAIFLLFTGVRREEATNLTWNQVDLEKGTVFIGETKDKHARIIPLLGLSYEVIARLGPELFKGLSKSLVTHKFTSCCKQAGLKGFKLHSLRHTFATRLVEHGTDILVVSKLLGHSDIRTTMVYAKVKSDVLRAAIERLQGCKVLVGPEAKEAKLLGNP